MKDPIGVAYIERTMIHRWNKESEAHKKQEAEAKRKTGRKRVPRRH